MKYYKNCKCANATYDNILNAVNELSKKLTANDNLLIYYAGYGYKNQDDQAYWLPVDATQETENNHWISTDIITEKIKLGNSLAKKVLIIADSCYSGTLAHQKWTVGKQTFEQDLLAKLPAYILTENKTFLLKNAFTPSRILIASGFDEPISDNGRKHSVFTKALLEGLQKREESVFTARTLFGGLIKEVVNNNNAKQTPEYRFLDLDRKGEFIFKKPGSFLDANDVAKRAQSLSWAKLAHKETIKGNITNGTLLALEALRINVNISLCKGMKIRFIVSLLALMVRVSSRQTEEDIFVYGMR